MSIWWFLYALVFASLVLHLAVSVVQVPPRETNLLAAPPANRFEFRPSSY